MFEVRAAARERGDVDVFVVPAGVTLKSERHANDGKDCLVVALPRFTAEKLGAESPQSIYAGAATLMNGKRLPCLMLGSDVAIGAEIVLDAHISSGETLLIVFDCEDGFALMRAPFTAELATQLQSVIAARESLPSEPVAPNGVCPTRTLRSLSSRPVTLDSDAAVLTAPS